MLENTGEVMTGVYKIGIRQCTEKKGVIKPAVPYIVE